MVRWEHAFAYVCTYAHTQRNTVCSRRLYAEPTVYDWFRFLVYTKSVVPSVYDGTVCLHAPPGPARPAALRAADDGHRRLDDVAGQAAHAWRGSSFSTCLPTAFPDTSRSIHAQVRPMPRSAHAQSRTACTHDPATVSVCMLRRIEAYMDAHRVLRGLICDQALLRAVALGYARYKVLLARRARTGRRLAVLPLLGLKKLGRRNAHRRHIAPCTAALLHGSSTVCRL